MEDTREVGIGVGLGVCACVDVYAYMCVCMCVCMCVRACGRLNKQNAFMNDRHTIVRFHTYVGR